VLAVVGAIGVPAALVPGLMAYDDLSGPLGMVGLSLLVASAWGQSIFLTAYFGRLRKGHS
jgi:hypothetical protein